MARTRAETLPDPNQSILFWPGHGFVGRFGPRPEDWEEVPGPEDPGVDDYEISKLRLRMKGGR